NIESPNRSAWEKFCAGDSVDRSEAERWPAAPSPEPAEVPAVEYRTNAAPGAPVGYASTSWPCLADSPGSPPKAEGEKGADPNAPPTIGCPVSRLPVTRDNWLQWTVQSFVSAPVDMLRSDMPPEIPNPGDRNYHGERIDITRVERGARRAEAKEKSYLGPRIVLRLYRSADGKTVPTSPIYLKGADLVLVLEPSRRPPKKNDPPRPPSTPGQSRPAPPKKEEEPERL